MSEKDHTDALLTLLSAAGVSVGIGERPDGLANGEGYGVLYPFTRRVAGSLDDITRDDRMYTAAVVCVGTGPEQAGWVADQVCGALLGVAPTVAGRVLSFPEHDAGPLIRDDDGAKPLWSTTHTFRYLSA